MVAALRVVVPAAMIRLSSALLLTTRRYTHNRPTTTVARGAPSFVRLYSTTTPTTPTTGRTVPQVLTQTTTLFTQHDVLEPFESTIHLLAKSMELPYETGYKDVQVLGDQRVLTPQQEATLQSYIARRLRHEPIQYIVGQWDFVSYTIAVRPPLLCPRPETEELVTKIIHECNKNDFAIQSVLDIGCGTGCIGLALADQLLGGPSVVALDVEPIAVQTSNDNAQRILKNNTRRYQAQLCSIEQFQTDTLFDLIVSNPPYIPQPQLDTLHPTVAQHESVDALSGGVDGMDVITVILQKLPSLLRPGGSCWMEVDPSHPLKIKALLQNATGSYRVQSFTDLFGFERFVKIVRLKE